MADKVWNMPFGAVRSLFAAAAGLSIAHGSLQNASLLAAEAESPVSKRVLATQQVDSVLPAARAPSGPERIPLPADADIKAAQTKVQEIFKAEFAAAKTSESKVKLARQVISFATADQPADVRAALLREGVRLAVEAGDAGVALDAAERLTSLFDVDRTAAKLELYQSLLRTVPPATAGELGQVVFKFADEAMRNEQIEVVEKALPILLSVARKARDPLLTQAVTGMKARLTDKATLAGKVAPLRAKLADSPDDPDVNLELGRLLCFTAGDWPEGLRCLAKSGDPALVAVARAELEAGDRPNAKVAVTLADAWCDCAQKQRGAFRLAAEKRALDHYLAATGSVGGLDGVRVGKQIIQLQKSLGFRGISTPLVNIKPTEVIDGAYPLFKHGSFNGAKYTVQGKEWPQSLFLLPKDGKTSVMRFTLPGTHRRMQGHVGIFSPKDVPAAAQPASPVVFTLVADGKTVWQSPALSKRDQIARFSIDVSNVTSLELRTSATGSANAAWAAWLDPELVE